MSLIGYIIIVLLSFLFGFLASPAIVFIRAKRDSHWDDSNIFNMYRVFAHIALHPGDLGEVFYVDGRKPFWYINEDEFSEVVDSRPKD